MFFYVIKRAREARVNLGVSAVYGVRKKIQYEHRELGGGWLVIETIIFSRNFIAPEYIIRVKTGRTVVEERTHFFLRIPPERELLFIPFKN